MDRFAGFLWIGSAIAAGFVHYRARGLALQAAVAACYALAIQFALTILALAMLHLVMGSSLFVESRGDFIKGWMGPSLILAVVAFWSWLLWKAKDRRDIDVRQ